MKEATNTLITFDLLPNNKLGLSEVFDKVLDCFLTFNYNLCTISNTLGTRKSVRIARLKTFHQLNYSELLKLSNCRRSWNTVHLCEKIAVQWTVHLRAFFAKRHGVCQQAFTIALFTHVNGQALGREIH